METTVLSQSSISIKDAVKSKLPFLKPADDAALTMAIIEVQYTLAIWLQKTGEDIEDDTKYNNLEKFLIADIVCAIMLFRQVVGNREGTYNSTTETVDKVSGKYLKKATAGSTSAEFAMPKDEEGGSVTMKTGDMLAYFKKMACLKAIQFGLSLCVCDDCSLTIAYLETDVRPPFLNFSC